MWSHQLTPEQRLATGISETLFRLSVGLEDERDLIKDFERALEAA
jgi:cystathionine beta-lyase/cystathionine gamma-synthase